MQRNAQDDEIPSRANLGRVSNPDVEKGGHEIGIENTSNSNPRGVEQERYEFDANGDEGQINDPRRESLSIEDSSRNKEPCVEFDRKTSSHTPSIFWKVVGYEHVQHGPNVVLNNGGLRLDAFGDGDDPGQINDKVSDGKVEE